MEKYEPMTSVDRSMVYLMITCLVFIPSLVGAFSPSVDPNETLIWLRVLSALGIMLSLVIYYGLWYDRKKEKEVYGK